MDLILMGMVSGVANGILAVGLVMVFMSNRVINLAHGEFGAFAVTVLLALYHNVGWSYWPALGTALLATVTLAAIVERTVIQRLFSSPRLILLVATLGLTQLIIVLRLVIPKPQAGGEVALAGGGSLVPLPIDWASVAFGRVVILPAHIVALIGGPLLALGAWAFLRFSAYGVALRAAAENGPRARLLGIPVRRVSTVSWVTAALLSAGAGILLAPVIGFSSTPAVGLPLLMRGLAAATVARFSNVGTAFGVGLAIGVLDYVAFFTTGRSGLTDIILLGLILVVLTVRKPAPRRSDALADSTWEVAAPVRPLPPTIVAHPRWESALTLAQAGGLMAIIAAPFVLTQSATFFLATVLLVACVAVSLTMLTGWGGHLSIGQWALAGSGAVIGAMVVTRLGLDFWLGVPAAAVAGGLVALAIGVPALRLEGSGLAVVTLGLAVAGSTWIFDQSLFQGPSKITRPTYLTNDWYYVVGVVALVLTVAVARGVQRSRIGRNILAVRDNTAQASAFGIEIVRTKLLTFVLTGIIAGAAGFLWSAGIGEASGGVFEPVRSLSLVAVVVIGGLGSITGAIIGAFWLLGIPYFGGQISPYIGLLTTGIGLLTLVLVFPGGLARLIFGARDLLAERLTGLEARPRVEPVGAPSVMTTGTTEEVSV